MNTYFEVSALPEPLRAIVSSLGCGKQVAVSASDTYTQGSPHQGQGSRGYTMLVNLATGERREIVGSWGGSNMFSPDNVVDNDHEPRHLPEGFACIQGCSGYRNYAHVYLHPKNFAPLLPGRFALTERERYLLDVYASLTSAGRKSHFERTPRPNSYYPHGGPPTELELASLVSCGMITRNKAGAVAITAKGRNDRGGKSCL